MMFGNTKKRIIKQYNQLREKRNYFAFCQAPFMALRFHRNGGVQMCCHHIDFQYLNEKSLEDIWFGAELDKMRKQMKDYEIPDSCRFCSDPFYAGDFSNVNALAFDYLKPNSNGFPVLMDFSLENTCNLSCIMCDASLSSSIQRDLGIKEKQTKFQYDENFIEQLTPFIEHLKVAVFTGGEPFLIKPYYGIWERMLSINPDIVFNITTNGTVYNDKIAKLLISGNFNITVSLDSLNKKVYEEIRKGAKFEQTLENVEQFARICKDKGTIFTITVCPMQINSKEMPEIVSYCNEKNWDFSYNTVLKPWNQALWSLPLNELSGLVSYYKDCKFETAENQQQIDNLDKFNSLIKLLENWKEKLNELNLKKLSSKQKQDYRDSLLYLIKEKLDNKEELIENINDVVSQIPEILIRQELVDYVKNMSSKIIKKEFDDYDTDTIADHLCIVAFNL